MKDIIKSIAILFLLVTASFSDFSEEQYIKNFTRFVEQVETNYTSYTEEDWYKKDKEFDTFTNERYLKYKREFTQKELAIIGKLKGRYTATRMKASIENWSNNLDNELKELEGFFEGLFGTEE